ncbi:MAG: glycerophosphodiester phosphodiesterase [Euryarchaeota archaeon]|nr:glycerophosphodiester phosphodiesterase [Euryarchaeota archaeon]
MTNVWPDRSSPIVLAHRGYHVRERENTLAAFDAALLAGAHGIEFDVRETRDGELVVHHDEALPTGRRGKLRGMDHKALPVWLPTLKATLAWARARRPVLLDLGVKEPGTEGEAARMVRSANVAEQTVITSFHPDVCFHVQEHFPDVPTGFLTEEALPEAVDVAAASGAKLLVLERRACLPELVASALERRLEVWAWGVNRAADARAVVGLGVRGLITDRPDRIGFGLGPTPAGRGPPRTGRRRGRPGS